MSRKKTLILFTIITAIAFYLRWLFLINDSFTAYEFYFIDIAKSDFFHLIGKVTNFTHHPVFLYVLHFWIGVFKISEFSTKFLPLLFGVLLVAAIPLTAYFDHDLFDKKSALLTAFMVALSPIHICFSRQVSPYSLFVLFSFLSNISFVILLKKTNFCHSIFYFFSMLLTIYSHMGGFVILFIHVLFILSTKQHIKKLLFIHGMLIISYLPWGICALPGQISHYLSAPGLTCMVKWDPPLPTPHTILKTFLDYAAGSYLLLFLFLFIAGYGLLKNKKNINSTLFLMAWMIVPPLVFYLISIFIVSIYKIQALFFISLPLYILVANGLMRFNGVLRAVFVLIIACVMCIKLFGTSFYQPQEDWKGLLSAVEKQSQSDVVIIYPPDIKNVVAHYFRRKFYTVGNVKDIIKVLSMKEATGRLFFVLRKEGDSNQAILDYMRDSNYNLVFMHDYKSFYSPGGGNPLSYCLFVRNDKPL